jgi:hypothetical protein
MASHTDSDLDYSLSVLEKLGKSFGILGNPERKAQMDAVAEKHFGKRGPVLTDSASASMQLA